MSESNQSIPTKNQRKADARWLKVGEYLTGKSTVTVVITGIAKNRNGKACGLNTKLEGLRAFLPASQVPRMQPLESLTGELAVKVIECDPFTDRGGRIVVSRTAHLGGQRQEALQALRIGAQIDGQVVGAVPDLGYFVNIAPGLDALLHHTRVGDQSFSVGDTVSVRVQAVDQDSGKVRLELATRASANAVVHKPSPTPAPKELTNRTIHAKPVKRETMGSRGSEAQHSAGSHAPNKRSKRHEVTFGSFSELKNFYDRNTSQV